MRCKYCYFSTDRHATWCPGYEHFTEAEQKTKNKIQDKLIFEREEQQKKMFKNIRRG